MANMYLERYNAVHELPEIHGKSVDRDLSWIKFNYRVLELAKDKKVPINERFNFLSITDRNLAEFISVRYSEHFNNRDELSSQVLDAIKTFIEDQCEAIDILDEEIMAIPSMLKWPFIDNADEKQANKIFQNKIFPLINPIVIDSSDSAYIKNMHNGESYIGVIFKDSMNIGIISMENIPKVFKSDGKIFLSSELIRRNINRIFINSGVEYAFSFRIYKDNSITIKHAEDDKRILRMKDVIRKRDESNIVFIRLGACIRDGAMFVLSRVFDIPEDNICQTLTPISDYSVYTELDLYDESNSYKPFNPNFSGMNIVPFDILKTRDVLMHHPYDSYDSVVAFIENAATDPMVVSIRQTLYRVSSIDSPIVNALCIAAKSGKNVIVLIEIKARFDEEQNIELINKLEAAGVTVISGLEYLKTHCKLCIVTRREKENGSIQIYSHIGTGNYNEKTSKLYTDISYFTSKRKMGMDLIHIFNILIGVSMPDEKLQKVFYAPINLRKRMIHNINREIRCAKKGKPAEIFLKLNSINDPEIINKLYEAGRNGVQVYIIARGICSMYPSKNIYIKSIVGRFLEHSRIYYFKNGGESEHYISSADMLTRNLDKRVEILLNITDEKSICRLNSIIDTFKKDIKNSFVMQSDGSYKREINGDSAFDCHQHFIENYQ